jgi:hypothetical protein
MDDTAARPVHFVEVAELVLASLVCEDLAHNDDIAQLIRSVGPTIVLKRAAGRASAPLPLDGPLRQRPGRRSGSAVLTLTSYGWSERSRPSGRMPPGHRAGEGSHPGASRDRP